MKIRSKEELFKEKFQELQRYSDTTLIVTLIADILSKNPSFGKVLFIEKELKKIDQRIKEKIINQNKSYILNNLKGDIKDLNKIEIDLITKERDYTLMEFKTSISSHEMEIEKTINQIKNRNTDLLNDFEVLEVSNIVFICHKDDMNNVLKNFKLKKKELHIDRPVSFLEWIHADNKDHEPCLYLEFKESSHRTDNKFVGEINKKNKISAPSNNLYLLRQKKNFIFTGKKPPDSYLLSKLHYFFSFYLHPVLTRPNAPDEYLMPSTLKELCSEFIEKNKNIYTKPRTQWFFEAIELFKKLEFIRVEGENVYFSIKNFTKNRREKDLDRFFSYFCASQKIKSFRILEKESKRKAKKKESLQKKIKSESLDKYFNQ